ncbi:MAG: hypothetical protein H5U04_04780 [Firmicutes bacterium]|nr:hypothetical protein [Bacillota bacterium]
MPGDGARIACYWYEANRRKRGLQMARDRWWLCQALNRRLRERTHVRQEAARKAWTQGE